MVRKENDHPIENVVKEESDHQTEIVVKGKRDHRIWKRKRTLQN
jgi:hypothetical protein